jgi:hypothetical protein
VRAAETGTASATAAIQPTTTGLSTSNETWR